MKRSGRRPGNQDTRSSILDAARQIFAEKGFDKASIRAIAADAGVDAALVHHYFGTKTQLFAAAIHIPIDPMDVIGPLRRPLRPPRPLRRLAAAGPVTPVPPPGWKSA